MYRYLSVIFPISLVILSVILHISYESQKNMENSSTLLSFPENLKFGFASASHQIEGAWNADGKGENIWDKFTHRPESFVNNKSTADVAADSYRHYKQDVALIKSMGGQVYRFSISWARLLPTGYANKINPAGVDYYNNLINELLANGIEPIVTLYHWDLPQPLQDIGGWPNEKLVDYFGDYARLAFKLFGDRVRNWITFNEPWETVVLGYSWGMFAPGIQGRGIAEYLAAHTLLKAHARAYHIYDDEFRSTQKGLVGITLSANWHDPKSSSSEDQSAAARHREFYLGWFAHPIFSKDGDYPKIMREVIDENSKKEKYPQSRLPTFNDYWIAYIRGSSDFFGVNHYTSQLITYRNGAAAQEVPVGWDTDVGTTASQHPNWPKTASVWFRVVPTGLRKALAFIKKTYDNPLVFITENGFSDVGGLEDDDRVAYFNSYLQEMLKAVHIDGVNIQLYTAWCLLDDFEWTAGYSERFGIVHVDFNDPDRKRTPKKSAEYFRRILKNRKIDAQDE